MFGSISTSFALTTPAQPSSFVAIPKVAISQFDALAPLLHSQWAYAAYLLGLIALPICAWRWRTRNMMIRQQELQQLIAQQSEEIEEKNRVLESIQQELQHRATHDTLTGLLNRGALLEQLEQEMRRCRREARPLVAAILDLDHFKRINDEYGHGAGDDVLATAAHRLSRSLRDYDACARYGSEEFVVILPGLRRNEAENRLEALRGEISAKPYKVGDQTLHVTASFGFAVMSQEDSVRSLLAKADKALYRAKATGRDRVCST